MPPGVTQTDSVPTSVVVGPDGAYYVGELTGIPFAGPERDQSNIYRVEAGQDPYHPTVFLDGSETGFNAIIDIAFKGRGLYVLQHWTTTPTAIPRDGELVRVSCGGRPLVCDGRPHDGPRRTGRADRDRRRRGRRVVRLQPRRLFRRSSEASVHTIGEVLRIDLGDGDDDDHHDHDGRRSAAASTTEAEDARRRSGHPQIESPKAEDRRGHSADSTMAAQIAF